MEHREIAKFEQEVAECANPEELGRKVKFIFKHLPGDLALTCFAKVMTSDLPHPLKVATWKAVRHSHLWWWEVDDALKGDVMNHPLVQRAFADALAMRKWMVVHHRIGSHILQFTVDMTSGEFPDWRPLHSCCYSAMQRLVGLIVAGEDAHAAEIIRKSGGIMSGNGDCFGATVKDFRDHRGNSILWYLTYREDWNPEGGFACPCIERELLRLGANPYQQNDLGLCWNDVAGHFVPERRNGQDGATTGRVP